MPFGGKLPALACPGCPNMRQRGFTLIELLVVVALIAIASGVASLSLRDGTASKLEHEGQRLAALLESARAEARASGLVAAWVPVHGNDGSDFHFEGLPKALGLPQRWLDEHTLAEVVGARGVVLGPEPMIGPQRIVLRLGNERLVLASDGLGPFEVVAQ